MPSACQVHSTAFEDELKYTDLTGTNCIAYETEQVSAEWRCRDQCLGYYINNYNYKDYTYDGKSCRAVVVYKDTDGFFKCELYDWDPHEIPSQLQMFKQSKCQVKSGVKERSLYILKHSCYAVTTPAPGDWAVSTLLPYLPNLPEPGSSVNCDVPYQAFERGTTQETFCEYAKFWKEGENPSRRRELREISKSFFKDFWDTGAQNDKLVELYGLDNYEINANEVLKHHCKMTCLQIQREYFIGLRDRPCRSVATVTLSPQLHRGKNQFCIYKSWPRIHRSDCMSRRIFVPGSQVTEYALKTNCYEPKGTFPKTIPKEPEEIEPQAPTIRPTVPVGYPDNYARCFTPARLPEVFKDDGQKVLSCKTNNVMDKIGYHKDNAHFFCTNRCRMRAVNYWYHRDWIALPDCKATSVKIHDKGESRVVVNCNYYSWAAGKRHDTCKEVENPENETLYVLDASCHEPEGITLRTCPTFGGTQIGFGIMKVTYTLENADTNSVAHLGTALFTCTIHGNNGAIAKFKCNDGHWDSIYGEDGVPYQNYWHYVEEVHKFYKKFNDEMTYGRAVLHCFSQCASQLPSIHSAAENRHVSNIAAGHKIWLGLKMDEDKDVWQWSDSKPVDFKSDLGRCPQLECPCGDNKENTCTRVEGQTTCVQAQNREWFWADGTDGIQSCTDNDKAKVVCQLQLTPNDDARLIIVWDDICKIAERENDHKTLKTCREVRKCEKYFAKCGKNKMTDKAVKCRALINSSPATTTEVTPRKLSLEWCKEKIEKRAMKPSLSCIKKCKRLYPGIVQTPNEKYSMEWCQEKMKAHRSKPRLQCIRKCKKILDQGGQTTKKPSQEEKYCREKIRKLGDSYPQLSCASKCKQKYG